MRTLELFSGTGSITKVGKKYGEVISLDITDKFGYSPTHMESILTWDYKKYPVGYFDFIWASPPCASFSSMLYISKTKDEIKQLELTVGLPLLLKAREIIDYFNPTFYCIENPDGGRMKNYITDLPYKRASYCQYGFDYRKTTRFWTNIDWINPKKCICKGRHKTRVTGGRASNTTGNKKYDTFVYKENKCHTLGQRYSIPQTLIQDIYKSITSPYPT